VDATSQARMPRDLAAPKTDSILLDLGAPLPHKPGGLSEKDLGAALPHEPSGLSDDDTEMESCAENDGIDDAEDWEEDQSLASMQQALPALAAAAAEAALDAAGFGSEDAIQQLIAQHCPVPSKRQGEEFVRRISVAEALDSAPTKPGTEALGRAPTKPGPGEINGRTTVMLRNLPNNYTRDMVMSLLDKEGFQGKFDFFYLPIDFRSKAGLGYAFVNIADPSLVEQFWNTFDEYSNWVLPSAKVCHMSWSGPHQGQRSHVERYRNSPIMHRSVPDEFKPVVLKDGVRIAFPPASRKVKAPRRRN